MSGNVSFSNGHHSVGCRHAQARRTALRKALTVTNIAAPPERPKAVATKYPPLDHTVELPTHAPEDIVYDAIVVGAGVGGLTAAAQMVAKGAKVLVLEKYLVPGGSAAHFKRQGFTFDVGSSMMFGFGSQGTTNLITKALQAVGKQLETIPDPTQVKYHMPKTPGHPQGLKVQVRRDFDDFVRELSSKFPHEADGIEQFYKHCWRIFSSLNTLELKSLEEPMYLMQQFFRHPGACLTLAVDVASDTGSVACRYIKDPDLLHLIDIECFVFSTVPASLTPMINAGMVLSDRFYGGVNYPVGGVSKIPETLAEGILEKGGHIVYKANVRKIITDKPLPEQRGGYGRVQPDGVRAAGVKLADGREFRARTVISNATRWDTFGRMIEDDRLPESEKLFRERYKKSPSFFTIHMGVDASIVPEGTDVHHIVLEDWNKMEDAHGTLFVSMPSILDPGLAPPGKHVVHAFTPDWIDAWQHLPAEEYERKKVEVADALIERLEAKVLPGLKQATCLREIGTPRTHRRYLGREDGTYGPIPSRKIQGMVGMPLNRTAIQGLYCVGDSTFPGQGVNAVAMSGIGCAHRVMCDLGIMAAMPRVVDDAFVSTMQYFRDRDEAGAGELRMEQLCDYVHMSASSCCAVCTDQAAQVGKDGWSVELFRRTKLIVLFGLAGHMHLDVAYPAPINLYSCVSAATPQSEPGTAHIAQLS
eukprot:CAMPEP_0202903422 /NCGR_PEP_ID=MMETSP1392-20130828/24318_1 /ASSEMBLY_ACC=CAM_ASM_000868 /TAXON_ID=225041 /ORGANISM="Chlamydomonas chlamydogama, Strain SAG 11-48b" /LENGTH=700 /DNA_ID=CAMNT_0049590589 /DNA_START=75 /DNA_END=2177 /DNA_ORIENTATION=+